MERHEESLPRAASAWRSAERRRDEAGKELWMKTRSWLRRCQHGGVLISALAFVAITSLLLVGMATVTVSHFARARTEKDYEAALGLAEAGVNYELRKLSANTSSADQGGSSSTYSLGSGTYTVYCSNKDGSAPWIVPNPLYVTSSGTVNGVTRTVRISAKGYDWTGKYAVYSIDRTSVWNGSSAYVTGDVATNKGFDFSGTPGINGTVYFNGPNAGWAAGSKTTGYTVAYNSQPVTWPTVDELANKKFPAGTYGAGGLLYLATNNDNAKANPPIVGNSITDNVTLKGPGNYYLTNIDLNGQEKISFDNTNGPVNIWIGPSGGSGTANFRGGTGAISATADPTKMNNIYVATTTGVNLAGDETLDGVVYAFNKDGAGNEYGEVLISGNPVINGQVLSDQVDINGNVTINYVQGVNKPSNYAYWGFDDQWTEINGM
jgi:Tfp pilus assembly protein PilX